MNNKDVRKITYVPANEEVYILWVGEENRAAFAKVIASDNLNDLSIHVPHDRVVSWRIEEILPDELDHAGTLYATPVSVSGTPEADYLIYWKASGYFEVPQWSSGFGMSFLKSYLERVTSE
ncbi:hypothetical protein [Mesorhizobium sp. SP-1A]|uniref:hypothetical protein n=1 Tax=Mesorhizobium sp. SP-1A TaxID=3077840 RepID=UPI0028F6C4C6|nr:hypothetical protein [Mesorhizobium sp. SP-1A]